MVELKLGSQGFCAPCGCDPVGGQAGAVDIAVAGKFTV